MKLTGYVDGKEHQIEVEPTEGGYVVSVDGATHDVDCATLEAAFYSLIIAGKSYEISVRELGQDGYVVRHGGYLRRVRVLDPLAAVAGAHLSGSGQATVTAAMPGRVVKTLVEEGAEVSEGQGVIVLEAMKMENEVPAPRAGKIVSILVKPGQTLEAGDKIAVVE